MSHRRFRGQSSQDQRTVVPEHIERLILDHLYFHARFRNVDDKTAEVTWSSGIDGTIAYLDRIEDELFRDFLEQRRGTDLLDLVNQFQSVFRSVVRSMVRRKLVNAFTDGYTVFPKVHVPLPNRWIESRSRLRIKGLTLTRRGFHLARRIYGTRYQQPIES